MHHCSLRGLPKQGRPDFEDEEAHRKRREAAVINIMNGRAKTKARQKVPISPALAEVLEEFEKV